jgi:hypothetical protein
MDFRKVPTVSEAQTEDWKAICHAYAKKIGAEVIFVNDCSCGLELSNGQFAHIYIEDMFERLGGMK